MKEWTNEWSKRGNERANKWMKQERKWKSEGIDEAREKWKSEGMDEAREGMKVNNWMNQGREWKSEQMNEAREEWKSERMDEAREKWKIEGMDEAREGMKENNWMNQGREWKSEQMNESAMRDGVIKERTDESLNESISHFTRFYNVHTGGKTKTSLLRNISATLKERIIYIRLPSVWTDLYAATLPFSSRRAWRWSWSERSLGPARRRYTSRSGQQQRTRTLDLTLQVLGNKWSVRLES